jgi:hypothetical protein
MLKLPFSLEYFQAAVLVSPGLLWIECTTILEWTARIVKQ